MRLVIQLASIVMKSLTVSTAGGMLPILAHEWGEADRGVRCGPPGRREAGGLCSQDPQHAGHHGRQATICRDY